VTFDEQVFPFSSLHPNAGARLRSELALLPDVLLNPSSTFLDVQVHDHNEVCSMPTNPSSHFGRSRGSAGSNGEQNHAGTDENGGKIGHDHMCHGNGDRACSQADPPAMSSSGSAPASGLGANPPSLSLQRLIQASSLSSKPLLCRNLIHAGEQTLPLDPVHRRMDPTVRPAALHQMQAIILNLNLLVINVLEPGFNMVYLNQSSTQMALFVGACHLLLVQMSHLLLMRHLATKIG
jgi:hypothetical protein